MPGRSLAAPPWAGLVAALTLAACTATQPPGIPPPTVEPRPSEAERFADLIRPWPIPGGEGVAAEPADPSLSLVARAFARLGVAPEVLNYRKDYLARDPFRLDWVDRALAEPLSFARDGRIARLGELDLDRDRLAEFTLAREWLGPILLGHSPPPLSSPAWETDLSRLPPSLAGALHPAAAAAARAKDLVARAFAALAPQERTSLRAILMKGVTDLASEAGEVDQVLALWSRVDLDSLLQAASVSVDGLEETRSRLARLPPGSTSTGADHDGILARIETPAGLIRVGGAGPSLHAGAALLSIDLGGDDIYDGACSSEPASVCLILDLAGNDLYRAEKSPGPGGGLLGVGVALDVSGNDTYAGSSVAFGSGVLGAGILIDEKGDDRYSADRLAEGHGFFGLGLLWDRSGDDHYASVLLSQGVGEPAGVGMLVDDAGDDLYEAGYRIADGREKEGAWLSASQGYGFGARSWGSGGVGLLLDRAGNDRYVASYFAQGGGYWYGIGLLLDGAGDDVYLARRYSQGAGIHAAVGMLRDAAGDDTYLSWGVSQGSGHDLGVGVLIDEAGDDSYGAQWLSQGAGNENGIGMLVDRAGNDRYASSGGDVQGWGEWSAAREALSFGLLLDGAGRDSYQAGGRDDASWVRGRIGVGVDAEEASPF